MQYQRLLPLKQIAALERGWTLDVLNVARSLGRHEFTNEDMYAHGEDLGRLHPENRHVTDKIRQQLQVLRDTGFLTHVSRGRWRLAQCGSPMSLVPDEGCALPDSLRRSRGGE